jgi:hypothetical protein
VVVMTAGGEGERLVLILPAQCPSIDSGGLREVAAAAAAVAAVGECGLLEPGVPSFAVL